LVWNVIVVSTLAQSYVDRAATGVGAVAEMAAERKAEKYHNLSSDHIFQPIAMENLGAFSSSSLEFLGEFGRRLGSLSGEDPENNLRMGQRWANRIFTVGPQLAANVGPL